MTAIELTPEDIHVDELRLLEAEAVHIIREVAAELTKPVLLFSAGKDSIVLLRLAEKAFRPAPLPFPVLHVDTGHNFDEVIEFRDRRVAEHGHKLIVGSVQESIDSGRVPDPGPGASRNRQQTRTLLDALEAGGFDAAFGGARRDEERARAKERILSFRDEFGQWDPRAQRPEPWSLYNGRIRKGEQVRVFPLSNWTELDIWRYIELEGLELRPRPAAATSEPRHIGAFAGWNTPELSASSSARITCTTALINARWVNACGKLPRWRPVRGSISSA